MPGTFIPNGFALYPPLSAFFLFEEDRTFNVEISRLRANGQTCNFSAATIYPISLSKIGDISSFSNYRSFSVVKIAISCRPNYQSETENPTIKNL